MRTVWSSTLAGSPGDRLAYDSTIRNLSTTSNQGPGTYARLKMRKDKDGLVSSVEVARI